LFSVSLEEAIAEVGLSMAKYIALTHLVAAGEPLSLSQCAERMTCVRSNITQLMDRLEADGLVRRVENPTDRRTVRAELTPLGIERQLAGAQQLEKVGQALSKKLAKAEWQTLARILPAFKSRLSAK
jgi:DNA-binding MarR family transcriptional regulator